MNSELQKQFEEIDAFTIIGQLKGSPVSPHVLKIKSYLEQLKRLGLEITCEFAINLVLQSLPDTFDQFIIRKNPKKRERDQGKGKGKAAIKASRVDALLHQGRDLNLKSLSHPRKENVITSRKLGMEEELLSLSRRIEEEQGKCPFDFRSRRMLAKGEVDLRVKNGARVV
ncbi:retrotransposon protein, putative, Ty1-copia subclass [Cucumis melo var. makuwa]|uniref:Retrotransposon protein, putative, Ty1-copia subclass n=1 Tax=Cucumis melo var. makuwa TaxID=1194695 RepID=A0A5A7T302_CUCMM|nr:retrotransposon protein, putative, Ty1-copia subclass [Cucumis melo var. makuwa]